MSTEEDEEDEEDDEEDEEEDDDEEDEEEDDDEGVVGVFDDGLGADNVGGWVGEPFLLQAV